MKYEYVECDCHSDEHVLRFIIDDDPEWPNIYVCTFLDSPRFWKRVWQGIKFIFGYKCRYGDFNETILSREQAEQVRDLCNRFLEQSKPVGQGAS